MAEIIIQCDNCNIELAAPEELIGQEVRCYGCQTLQVIKAPEPVEDNIPTLQAPKAPEPVEIAPTPAPAEEPVIESVEAPAFSPMLEISPDSELEMPQPATSSSPKEGSITNLNSIPNPLDEVKASSEEPVPPPAEIPTLNIETPVPMEPVAPPEPEPDPPIEEEITFRCIGCKSILLAPSEHIGYNVRCDKCDTKMPVPEASNASVEAEKAPEPEPETIPLPTPDPSIPVAPITEKNSPEQIKIPIPTPQPEPAAQPAPIPKAPIALDDDDDDKTIPKLRPPPRRR